MKSHYPPTITGRHDDSNLSSFTCSLPQRRAARWGVPWFRDGGEGILLVCKRELIQHSCFLINSGVIYYTTSELRQLLNHLHTPQKHLFFHHCEDSLWCKSRSNFSNSLYGNQNGRNRHGLHSTCTCTPNLLESPRIIQNSWDILILFTTLWNYKTSCHVQWWVLMLPGLPFCFFFQLISGVPLPCFCVQLEVFQCSLICYVTG